MEILKMEEQTKKIVDLNFDVLDLIYGHLQLEDQLNLARANLTLSHAFVYRNRNRFRVIDDNPPMDIADWSTILSLCGKNVITLLLRSSEKSGQLVELAQQLCPNIETIRFKISDEDIDKIADCLPQIKSLNRVVIGMDDEDNIRQNIILQSLQRLPNLRKLILSNFRADLISHNFSNLVELTELRLERLAGDVDILKICEPMKNLRSLDLCLFPHSITTEILVELAVKCPLLEELKLDLSLDKVQIHIPQFPKLKYLYPFGSFEPSSILSSVANNPVYQNQLQQLTIEHYYGREIVDWKLFGKLRALKELKYEKFNRSGLQYLTQLKDLERLSITTCITPAEMITGSSLLPLLRECKKLRCLDIQFCSKINNEFVHDALKTLTENGVQPQKPFVLMAYRSGINPTTIKTELSRNPAAKLLDLRLEREKFTVSHLNENLNCKYGF